MSDKQQIKEMAHENVRATGRALEHLRLPHNPDFYYAGNTFNLALDVINALEASLQAETARADKATAACEQAYSAINDAIMDAEDTREAASLGCLITNATLRKLKEARAALSTPQKAAA